MSSFIWSAPLFHQKSLANVTNKLELQKAGTNLKSLFQFNTRRLLAIRNRTKRKVLMVSTRMAVNNVFARLLTEHVFKQSPFIKN